MDMLKLLIAEGTEEFRIALADALQGAYITRTCHNGRDALELLRSFRPDVMILDLMLPGLDGISLLQEAAASGIRPMVLATSRFVNEYVLEAADQLGIGYLMRKPCDVRATVARLGDLTRRIHRPVLTKPDPRTAATNMLLALGFPTKLRGYTYLREAVLLMAKDPGQSITKELYPAVAKLCGGKINAKQVERSSRSAIERAWALGDPQLWLRYFPAASGVRALRPSNSVFICRLADSLRMMEENTQGFVQNGEGHSVNTGDIGSGILEVNSL